MNTTFYNHSGLVSVLDHFNKIDCPDNRAKNAIYRWALESLGQREIETVEESAKKIFNSFPEFSVDTNQKRYRFKPILYREKLWKDIFERSFKESPYTCIAVMENLDAARPMYSRWKKACWIELPKGVAAIFANKILKVAVAVASMSISLYCVYRVYQLAIFVFTAKILPLVINHAPLKVIHTINSLLEAKERIADYVATVIVYLWFTKLAIHFLPRIPYVTQAIERIDINRIWRILYTDVFYNCIASNAIGALSFGWKTCDSLANFSYGIGQSNENKLLNVCKPQAYDRWHQALEKHQLGLFGA